jgi:hypothetical protein
MRRTPGENPTGTPSGAQRPCAAAHLSILISSSLFSETLEACFFAMAATIAALESRRAVRM